VAVASSGPYASLHLAPDRHHASTPALILQAGCPSCRPTNSVKALKALSSIHAIQILYRIISYQRAVGSVVNVMDFCPLATILSVPGELLVMLVCDWTKNNLFHSLQSNISILQTHNCAKLDIIFQQVTYCSCSVGLLFVCNCSNKLVKITIFANKVVFKWTSVVHSE